ncbi:MAG: hydrogenase maturation protease [Pseudomonadota bacterium]|jgi:hydrogenase maturation protease
MHTLVFGYGNPSRGDDALGPLFVERLAPLVPEHPEWGRVECLTDFQLQVEHALDMSGRDRVLFVDASASCAPPCDLFPLEPVQELAHTSHALRPGELLRVFAQVTGRTPPPAWVLAIRGASFDLGEPLSHAAAGNLEVALVWAGRFLAGRYPPYND